MKKLLVIVLTIGAASVSNGSYASQRKVVRERMAIDLCIESVDEEIHAYRKKKWNIVRDFSVSNPLVTKGSTKITFECNNYGMIKTIEQK